MEKEYYLNKGFSDNKASCLAIRDILLEEADFKNKKVLAKLGQNVVAGESLIASD